MTVTLEINQKNALFFLENVKKLEGFVNIKQIQDKETHILPPKNKVDVTTLRLSVPFLSEAQIDHDFEQMRNEWESI